MEALLFWNLRAAIYLLIFAVAYLLVLRRNASASFNRFYILISSLLALLLPLLPTNFVEINAYAVFYTVNLPEILIDSANNSVADIEQQNSFSINLLVVFALISLGFVLQFVVRLLVIGFLIWRGKSFENQGMILVTLKSDKVPFSFFKWLFVSDHLLNDQRFDAVLAHEKAHAKR
ncbi:MAG: hypothetical protein PHP48_12510, partial [Bacteroidales bacterium]|nr:hypothetical protein [Bacteroidales bacterium]